MTEYHQILPYSLKSYHKTKCWKLHCFLYVLGPGRVKTTVLYIETWKPKKQSAETANSLGGKKHIEFGYTCPFTILHIKINLNFQQQGYEFILTQGHSIHHYLHSTYSQKGIWFNVQ